MHTYGIRRQNSNTGEGANRRSKGIELLWSSPLLEVFLYVKPTMLGVSVKLVPCFGSKNFIGRGWMQIRRASGVGGMIRLKEASVHLLGGVGEGQARMG